jgi:mutator protein MutT
LVIHVMVGVLIDDADRVLIAQRVAGKPHAGAWEFPGGKLEQGEERLGGLARELREELGISIGLPRPLIRVSHEYPNGRVLLDVWTIRRFSGEPRGLDGQLLRWCPRRDLKDANLLPADRPIVAVLTLPEVLIEQGTDAYAIESLGSAAKTRTSDRLAGVLCATAADAEFAAAGGADFLVMNAAMPAPDLTALCASIAVPIFAADINLETAWTLGASGVSQLRF